MPGIVDVPRSTLLRVRAVLPAVAAMVLASAYCVVFFVPTGSAANMPWNDFMAVVRSPSRWLHQLAAYPAGLAAVEPPVRAAVTAGLYLLMVAGVIPWLILAVVRRGRPYDLGCRWPNRYAWRVLLIGYLVAVPFLAWMVRGTRFAGPYLSQLERWGGPLFFSYYLINMLTEHFLFHGAFLAAFRVGCRWPAPPPVDEGGATIWQRALRWLGLGQSTDHVGGMRGVTRWMGLPAGCVPAVLASAALFGVAHAVKDFRELLLSLPGGVALAFIAYRTNSWLTPFALHVATAGTACAMIVWGR
ncbi:MAG: CPBP family intramembrane metalloprotease [Phycisphaerae bacterium]